MCSARCRLSTHHFKISQNCEKRKDRKRFRILSEEVVCRDIDLYETVSYTWQFLDSSYLLYFEHPILICGLLVAQRDPVAVLAMKLRAWQCSFAQDKAPSCLQQPCYIRYTVYILIHRYQNITRGQLVEGRLRICEFSVPCNDTSYASTLGGGGFR